MLLECAMMVGVYASVGDFWLLVHTAWRVSVCTQHGGKYMYSTFSDGHDNTFCCPCKLISHSNMM